MQFFSSFWDSHPTLSTVGTILKFISAISGILVLVFGLRETSLRAKAQQAEKEEVGQRIGAAEAATKPRRLSSEQKAALIQVLQQIGNKPMICICAGILDSESMAFAGDLEGVFAGAGFEVRFPKDIRADTPLAVEPSGLHMAVKDPSAANPAAAKIQKCFMDVGVRIPAFKDEGLPVDRIEVIVGQR
jgi:hypothetical protein